ncbi:YeeE/YedE thiosulfate transporter family protein [Marinomonas sp. TI.3.20]|uniref:YeeE/YedE family protein n=1 Tax=Marinomonas sp. TI.3.20 TaxID=3121296 RepID=UPI00311FA0A0
MTSIFNPLAGGLLIGLAAAIYLITTGKVLGISGILSQAMFQQKRFIPLVFLVGLVIGGSAYGTLTNQTVPFPDVRSPFLLIISGLLVGYGTRLGSGCTSGHGVCGLARLSPRSIVATGIFMATAIITVYFTK